LPSSVLTTIPELLQPPPASPASPPARGPPPLL
jgi:hypothetical protein